MTNLSEERLTAQQIRMVYEMLRWKDFIETVSGWNVSLRRISRILGKKVGQRYKRSRVYDKSACNK